MCEDLSTLGGHDDTGMVWCNICGWQAYAVTETRMEITLLDHLQGAHALKWFYRQKPDGTREDIR